MTTRHVVFSLVLVLFGVLSVGPSAFGTELITETVKRLESKNEAFTGDLGAMVERKYIRVLIPPSRTFYFFDGAEQKGMSYEAATAYGNFLNKSLKSKHVKVKILIVPTSRDELFMRLKLGLGDIAIGNLTITDERRTMVDFSDPFMSNVSEILVTPKGKEKLGSPLDLAGLTIHVRRSSSYHESLLRLNDLLEAAGKLPVDIVPADEHLEDEDLLEMVNANLIPGIIMDKHKAEFWAKILPDIQLHTEVEVASNAQIAWAIRKNSPELKKSIDAFVKKNKKGTLTGNVVFNRYLKDIKYINDSTHGANIERFKNVVGHFQKYGDQYKFDHLMLTALAYQESRLDQSTRSHAGAVGVMQILPSTAKYKEVGIPDIEKLEPNIHAGTKYLRYLADKYFPKESGLDPLNRALFTFASYNAGPNRIVRFRQEAEKEGLNKNLWFNNVELIAARKIGRETVQYVSNIFKYYIAYKLMQQQEETVAKKQQKTN